MITWMQRHKKYLIITIWISTIAFVGAGFVGWGQYDYGDKAGAVAKVGEVEITMGELQQSYSSIYGQYNKMLQGKLDEEQAKKFGLKKQALDQLVNQALILNLAKAYDLTLSNKEMLVELQTQEFFFKDGKFDKEVYKTALSNNRLTVKSYEASLRKELLIRKVLKLLNIKATPNEENIIATISAIADRVEYKVLSQSSVTIDSSDAKLKQFWENKKLEFMSEVSYEVEYIKEAKVTKEYANGELDTYYNENRTHFKDSDGKILAFEDAKSMVADELNANATKNLSLRTYINYKKGKLSADIPRETTTISSSVNTLNSLALDKITSASLASPFVKPVLVNGDYHIFKLTNINSSKVKSFEDAKAQVLPLYMQEQKRVGLATLAQSSLATFKGTQSEFVTSADATKLAGLALLDANDFLIKLFTQTKKRGFITLNNGNIVLFNILEQKLLKTDIENPKDSILNLKSAMFNEGLIKNLRNKYKTEIFMQGL